MASGNVFDKTVPLVVEAHGFGERRKASLANVSIEGADDPTRVKENLALSKRLLNSDEIRAIRQRDHKFRTYLQSVATPFRPGFYLVPVGLVEQVDAEAKTWQKDRDALVDVAVRAYPGHVKAMATELGVYYNPLDYPPTERFRSAWWTEYQFVDFGVPNLLRTVKAEIFSREREKVERKAAEARTLIEQHLAASLLDITTHLAHLLAPKGDGKYPALRDKALDRLFHFLDTLAARDVTDFKALQAVTRKLHGVVDGINVDVLRDDDARRNALATAMVDAKAEVAKLVDEDRVRGIILTDDAAVA